MGKSLDLWGVRVLKNPELITLDSMSGCVGVYGRMFQMCILCWIIIFSVMASIDSAQLFIESVTLLHTSVHFSFK